MKKVPPIVINQEGVSWLASQVGRPINKFVRDGLDVKVCVVNEVSEVMKTALVVDLEDGENAVIEIEVPEIRKYKAPVKRWEAVEPQMKNKEKRPSSPKSSAELPTGGAGEPEVNEEVTAQQSNPGSTQQKQSPKPGSSPPEKSSVDDSGTIVSEDEEQVDESIAAEEPVKAILSNATFGDFFNPKLLVTPKGVVTRNKKRRR
ncbi:hypothetical protein LINPERPRIM_LOCUS6223 [Linum perenne]